MKRLMLILIVLSLLVISGCKEGVTGKSVVNPVKDSPNTQKINECVKLCSDGSRSTEEFLNSCTKILQYGGEKVFNEYVEACKK